jgi:hypothetical protein
MWSEFMGVSCLEQCLVYRKHFLSVCHSLSKIKYFSFIVSDQSKVRLWQTQTYLCQHEFCSIVLGTWCASNHYLLNEWPYQINRWVMLTLSSLYSHLMTNQIIRLIIT